MTMESSPLNTCTMLVVLFSQMKKDPSSEPATIYWPLLNQTGSETGVKTQTYKSMYCHHRSMKKRKSMLHMTHHGQIWLLMYKGQVRACTVSVTTMSHDCHLSTQTRRGWLKKVSSKLLTALLQWKQKNKTKNNKREITCTKEKNEPINWPYL